jgi:ABC-2 type transport system ATP-binding protein
MNNATDDRAQAVTARSLHKRFGQVRAVAGVDLDIPLGQIAALLGPNGAGKTTTFDMLLGLLAPDHGEVALLGRRPRQALDDGQVGVMLQRGDLPRGGTVAELLRAFAALHRAPAPAGEVASRAGLAGLLGRRVEKLSGGEAQRVRFALALIGDPRLLVLDEPTAGLDVTMRREFWAHAREFAASGRTILFSTHYLEEADDNANRILVMTAGRVVADGPAAAIKAAAADRVIRCTLPSAARDDVLRITNVTSVEAHDGSVLIHSTDADATLHALLRAYPQARNIEVTTASISDAFLALTSSEQTPVPAAAVNG